MKVFEAIKKRRSVRQFDPDKKVSNEQIKHLLEAASWSPSAGNLQSYFFFVVSDQKTKEQLVEAAHGQEFIGQAPVVFVSCADSKRSSLRYRERGETLYAVQDATIATYSLCLAATEIGLASCWVGAFSEEWVREILTLPENLRPIAILPVGYPKESPAPPPRRKINQISKKV